MRSPFIRALIVAICLAVSISAARSGRAAIDITAIDGRRLTPFAPAGAASVIFFVATDCPISNGYAPEIQRVCRDYGSNGVSCALMYEDVDVESSGARGSGSSKAANTRANVLDDAVRKHLREFGYGTMSAAIDRARTIATRAKATITPQAVVVDHHGEIRYRGRIDNFYAALGKPRQQVTEHDLRDALDDLLTGRPVTKPETQALGCHIVEPNFPRK